MAFVDGEIDRKVLMVLLMAPSHLLPTSSNSSFNSESEDFLGGVQSAEDEAWLVFLGQDWPEEDPSPPNLTPGAV